ncbi:hypothetical protein CANINC_000963 [Pichia inconspicua]|uniref:Eukaryotic translation initiation factor 3 subunit D n=1 Tax=Pichia inconspicua TaxID=52247 RepID=A0A4T0X630_9ASCO|nr:hypothetical protein CANINC_000963 [[Candida] inconspicua]
MLPFQLDISALRPIDDPWGPTSKTPASLTFNGVPYAPFIKSDKLGKIADWQSVKEEESSIVNNQQKKRDQYHAYGASAAKMFGAEAEDKGFSVVETSFVSSYNKQAVLKSSRKQTQTSNQTAVKKPTATVTKKAVAPKPAKWGSNNKWGNSRWNTEELKPQKSSIAIDEKWTTVSEIEFNRLTKLNLESPQPELLSSAGKIHQYVKKYEQPTTVPLEPTVAITVHQTSSKDPNFKSMAQNGKGKVFITDEILSQLMCAPKSSVSWDVIISKKDGNIFFDKRNDTFDLPLNENSPGQELKETDINHDSLVKLEAQQVIDDYISGCLGPNAKEFPGKNPIPDMSAIQKGYKYSKYQLLNGDNDESSTEVIVRSTVDAYTFTVSSTVAIRALFQFESNDWKSKLQGGSQGNVISDEIKKNNNKISQWTTQAVLAGSKSIKIGFICRDNLKLTNKHSVVGTMTFGTDMLCQQLNVSLNNGWGIVKSLIDIIEHVGGDQDYRFVIVKSPNVMKIVIYRVPIEAFEF